METVAIVVMGACAVLAVWGVVKFQRDRVELDHEKRLAELNRLDARAGRLRRPSEP